MGEYMKWDELGRCVQLAISRRSSQLGEQVFGKLRKLDRDTSETEWREECLDAKDEGPREAETVSEMQIGCGLRHSCEG